MLRRLKDGSFTPLSTDRDLGAALARREQLDAMIYSLSEALYKSKTGKALLAAQDEQRALTAATDAYALANIEPGASYERDGWRVTTVQSTTKRWDADVLKGLISPFIFKAVTKLTVVPDKVDEMVRAKKITLDQIEAAFSTTANKPYVKVTQKGNAGEADSLAEKLA